MTQDSSENQVVLSRLNGRETHRFDLRPDDAALASIRSALDLRGLRKVRLAGELAPEGRTDWRLSAHLGATVVQDCVVTLDPVTTRIEEPVVRRYLADFEHPTGAEVEMTEDETVEPLPAELDLLALLEESLALVLPPYPRAAGAEVANSSVTEPGVDPLTDDEVKPFAGLAGLREKLSGGGS